MKNSLKSYLFLSTEGYTTSPNGEKTNNNCQVLGVAVAYTPTEAWLRLIEFNPWIIKQGFKKEDSFCYEVVGNLINL